jgi:Caspase domain
VRWAIVIGIDEYGHDDLRLSAAVDDAEMFHEWVVRESGGDVPAENVRVLLARSPDDPDRKHGERVPTKDNIVAVINEVMAASGGGGDVLFFFYSGHGITARYAGREESALVTPGFDELHTDHTLAVRSLTEFFETTQFRDQVFFVDACRNAPRRNELEIGRWPVPRRRDPGQPPVQQFILYATSPGLTAAELGWPGEAVGAFTEVLMAGLAGDGRAKAWSWERNRYEVRWERLATYVNTEMASRKLPTKPPPGTPRESWPIQIPQDAGSRGVAGRDRDPVLALIPRGAAGTHELILELEADPKYDEAELSVLDAAGEPIASALNVTGTSHRFTLPPKTYAARATTLDGRVGHLIAPIELYDDCTEKLELRPRGARRPGEASVQMTSEDMETAGDRPDGTIEIRSADPLAIAEILDEAGRPLAVTGGARDLDPGFYRVRQVGPEQRGKEHFVVLRAGKREPVELSPPAPTAHVASLAAALGGGRENNHVIPVTGAEPVAWARPSTVVAAGIGAALQDDGALKGLGLPEPPAALREQGAAVALYAVAADGDSPVLEDLSVRAWRAGEPPPEEPASLEPNSARVRGVVMAVDEPEPHWLSIEPGGSEPTVVALPVLSRRIATLVAEVDGRGLRLYQFHPTAGPGASSTPDRLRRMEHLQRLLLGGGLDGALPLAEELAKAAADDPFAGCLAGYVLLRLDRPEPVSDIASEVARAAPGLSDAYILRAEYEAIAGNREAAGQAFADAVNAGIPAFGEGLTRLVEGLRTTGFLHPRGALVRHVFQRHARGNMWAAFTPRRGLRPGRLAITGADLGYEG